MEPNEMCKVEDKVVKVLGTCSGGIRSLLKQMRFENAQSSNFASSNEKDNVRYLKILSRPFNEPENSSTPVPIEEDKNNPQEKESEISIANCELINPIEEYELNYSEDLHEENDINHVHQKRKKKRYRRKKNAKATGKNKRKFENIIEDTENIIQLIPDEEHINLFLDTKMNQGSGISVITESIIEATSLQSNSNESPNISYEILPAKCVSTNLFNCPKELNDHSSSNSDFSFDDTPPSIMESFPKYKFRKKLKKPMNSNHFSNANKESRSADAVDLLSNIDCNNRLNSDLKVTSYKDMASNCDISVYKGGNECEPNEISQSIILQSSDDEIMKVTKISFLPKQTVEEFHNSFMNELNTSNKNVTIHKYNIDKEHGLSQLCSSAILDQTNKLSRTPPPEQKLSASRLADTSSCDEYGPSPEIKRNSPFKNLLMTFTPKCTSTQISPSDKELKMKDKNCLDSPEVKGKKNLAGTEDEYITVKECKTLPDSLDLNRSRLSKCSSENINHIITSTSYDDQQNLHTVPTENIRTSPSRSCSEFVKDSIGHTSTNVDISKHQISHNENSPISNQQIYNPQENRTNEQAFTIKSQNSKSLESPDKSHEKNELLTSVGKSCLESVVKVLHMYFGGNLENSFKVLLGNKFNVLTTIQELQILHPDHEPDFDNTEDDDGYL